MVKTGFSVLSLLSAGLLLAVTANAAVETFAGVTSTQPLVATSSMTGGIFTKQFGPPEVAVGTTGALPALADGRYLSYSNSTDAELTLTATAIALTTTEAYVALAFRAPTISATATDNNVDILRVQDSGGNLFGLVVANGVLRMANTNGWGSTRILYSNIATAPGANNWVILAGRLVNSTTAGGATAKWWSVNPTTGAPTVLFDDVASATSTVNTGVGDASILQWGATFRFPSAPVDALVINVDDVRIEAGTTYANEAAFLSAVAGSYTVASVQNWSMFD